MNNGKRSRLLAWLERHQYLVLAVAGLLLLAGLLVRDITESDPPALVIQDAQQDSGAGTVVVHVAGAVGAPGVYELPAGARVQDAVVAAGGATAEADVDSLNLARPLRDGERITLLSGSRAAALAQPTLAPGQTLDLNRATQAQLDALPGIGEAYSRRIVDSRTVDGPYASVDDLVSRSVVPAATLAAIRDYLTVAP